MREQEIELVNKRVLKIVEKGIGHNKTTNGAEISQLGKKFLGSSFKGVFTADTIPNLKNGQSIIANLDNSSMPGSHWVSMIRLNNKNYFYDSFGRKGGSIMEHATKKLRDSLKEEIKLDSEQGVLEENCGQRSIAWLLIAKHWGITDALLV